MEKNFDLWVFSHLTLKKLIMELKIAFLLIVVSVSNIFATPTYSQVAKVSLDMENKSLERVLDEIERQSEFYFVFNQKQIDVNRVINIKEDNKLIKDILPELFKGTNVNYEVFDRKILLTTDPLDNNLLAIASVTQPQQNRITGTVTAKDGTPMPGVNIVVYGTTQGTITDVAGKYSIEVPQGSKSLTFSFIGMESQEISIGILTQINVTMIDSSVGLKEVVVTALGIKREAKTLGYATAVVNQDLLTDNRTTTAIGTLQGKVSGVNITSFGTGPEGATRIRIRGNSAFQGQNIPLLVVNGVPIDNTRFGGTSEGNVDLGDGLSSINPDEIETMTVLKGAAAAALYGSRAKDGVIMITTRSGMETKGFGVTYNMNYTTEKAVDYTDFQYEYGQGEKGIRPTVAWPTSGVWSFGEKIVPGMTQVLFDNVTVPYVAVTNKERYKEFYRTGQNLTNTISFSNSGDNGGFDLSIGNTKNTAILENSEFTRRNITVGFTQNISKWINVSGNVNYSNEYYKNAPMGMGNQSSPVNTIATMSNTMPLDLMKKYSQDPITGKELIWSRFLPRVNPFFLLDNMFDNNKRDRVLGNVAIKFNVTKDIYIQGRVAQDFYTRLHDYNSPTGRLDAQIPPAGYVDGTYNRVHNTFRERNYDFLIIAKHKFADIGVNLTAGGNQMFRSMESEYEGAQDFVQPGLYTIMNGRLKSASHDLTQRAVNSIYGAAEVSYKNFLFLNATARNDWFSTLAPKNRSILYPSVTGSFIFTDAIKGLPKWLSFGKLRLSYAAVGDDNVDAYSNLQYYSLNSTLFAGPAGSVPVGGFSSVTIANPNLRPLSVSETEGGFDLRLFNNRFSFDFALYHKLTSNQIVSATTSQASGFSSQLINVGQSVSKGFESSIQVSPIQTNAFTWSINANISYNTSEVLKLGLSSKDTVITVNSVYQIVGRPLGQLYYFMQATDANGNKIFDKNSGYPVRSSNRINVGTCLPTWFGGITNTFNFKGVILTALIDFKLGKNYVSNFGANHDYWRHGKHKGTLPGRDVGYVIGDGVNPDGSVNTTQAQVQPYYESFTGNGIEDPFVSNAGYWKLRQISLGYDFVKFLPKIQYIKGLKLSIVCNNVAILKKWVPNMDPEDIFTFDDTSLTGNVSGYPSTRSMGFNLNVKF
jgi:TonB-linked SusC/RagA family outer membrane protein